jgi:hypothetical protein
MIKKTALLVLCLFSFNALMAQEMVLKLFNEHNGKEITIKENMRIRLKTASGESVSGRLRVIDPETIGVDDQQFTLEEIAQIKRHPLAMSLLVSGTLYYLGGALLGAAVIVSIFPGNPAGLLLALPAAACIYGGIKSPNVLNEHKKTNGWRYEIITPTE